MIVKIFLITTITSFIRPVNGIVGFMLETTYKGEIHTLYDFRKVYANKETSELIALIMALGHLQKPCDIELEASTALAYSRLNTGILDKWESQGWLNSRKEKIKDAEKWKRLHELYEKNVISLVFTRADHHSYTRWMMDYIEKNKENIKEYENDGGTQDV